MAENTDESTRDRIVRLAFEGDEAKFERFIDVLREVAPPDCQVILRGSVVTGTRWEDGQPFDAAGPGTSDVDVTFISPHMLSLWEKFYIPEMLTAPLNDENPDACPALLGLRGRLCHLIGRPVNLQASRNFVQFARDLLFDQPYYTLIDKSDENDRATPAA